MKQFLLHLLLFVPSLVLAQSFTMNGTPINACSGSFFDPGGPSGEYGNNLNVTTTLCAGVGGASHVRLDFDGLQLDPGDLLCFYDGTTSAAPELSCSNDYPATSIVVVQATAANPSGCLTLVFQSNGVGTSTGWAAAISCVKSCQILNADLVSTTPATVPADTGWIDICPGDRITFNGLGIYPQNDLVYHQSDFTTSFEWNFGDGDIAYGPTVAHKFNESGGFYVQLTLRDSIGCPSTNLISQRVRVAPRPDFSLTNAYDNSICAGDTIQLSAQVNAAGTSNSNLNVGPGQGSFNISGTRADSLALPDGTGIDYETSIYFTEFTPGQVLTDINDLLGICVNMEHSWARDIQIKITCPNGTDVILHNHAGQIGDQVFLGIPNDNDNFNPVPGTGFDYCWTPFAFNDYWIEYFNSSLGGSNTLPADDYQSFEPLDELLGCPLNGEWTITITDYWPIDNGYIFNWGVNFNQDLYPSIETFSPTLANWQWQPQPTIFFSTQDSIAASPANAGLAAYTFRITDSFGCKWDSTLNVNVLPFTHPECYNCKINYNTPADTIVCANAPVTLDASTQLSPNLEVRFESAPSYKFGASNHPHSNPYIAPVNVNSLGYTLLTNPIAQIQSVCMDINTDFDADVFVYLRSPDNKQIELTTANGGSGDNYKVTCFSPTSSTPINSGMAPFNGTFAPEGNWSALNGAQVNGDWKLYVSDGFGQNQLGTLNSWSIGFNVATSTAYSWSPATGLSCNNCPNPVATLSQPTTYVLSANDNFGCNYKDTITVTAQNFFPAPTNLTMVGMDNGSMTWTWTAVPNITDYEVNINGAGWILVTGTTYTVTGLTVGQNVSISVRVANGSVNCPPALANGSQTFFDCTLETTLDFTASCSCFGSTNGAVNVLATGGQGQTVFYTNFGPSTPYTNGNLTFYPAGNYFVFAVDAVGCRDTTYFTISQPNQIDVTFTPTNVACFGANTGAITALASGGTGNLTYIWQNCASGAMLFGSTIINIAAGCYNLTITDQTGCTRTATQNVDQNPPLALMAVQDSVACFGGNNGGATISISGGLSPYSILWSNGNTTPTATNLAAGFHSVTITDAANCNSTTVVDVKQPALFVLDSIVAGAETCFGVANGAAKVFPNGGISPYKYQWSVPQTAQTAINLAPGTYTVTVTDINGCTIVAQTTITAAIALVATTIAVAPQACTGQCNGAATLQISGGTIPYAIDWNTAGIPDNILTSNVLCVGNYSVSVTDANGCTAQIPFTIDAATPMAFNFEPNDPSCPSTNDGSIVLGVTGGAMPYTFLWSNAATTKDLANIGCANYTVTVTDNNGCTGSSSQSLDCPDALQITGVTVQNALCFGASNATATANVTGGSGTYNFLWSSLPAQTTAIASGLPIGTYTVTVSDTEGCSVTSTATVGQPAVLSATATASVVDCFGGNNGSVDVTVTGGVGPYNYLWTNNAATQDLAQVQAGNYSVTITDQNSCSFVLGPNIVLQPAGPITVTAVQTTTTCFGVAGGAATATASGGNGLPYTYQWSNNTTGSAAQSLSVGTYTVVASDGKGCMATATVAIAQYDSIQANILLIEPTCYGDLDGQAALNLVQGGAGGGQASNYTFQWGGLPGAPMGEYWDSLPGDKSFFLKITDQAGCSRTFNLILGQPTQVIPSLDLKMVTCFGAANGQISISSYQGDKPVASYAWSVGTATGTSIGQLDIGTYTTTITDVDGCTGTASGSITQPLVLELDFIQQQIDCSSDNNGVLEAKPSGGTAPYSYLWSNGGTTQSIGNLGKGQYMLTLTDANGCIVADSSRIDEPTPPEITVRVKDLTCSYSTDGRMEILIEGATPPFKYGLNDGPLTGSPVQLALGSGTYAIRVVDGNNCTYTTSDTITAPPPFSVNIDPQDAEITYGEQLTLAATATNPQGLVDYVWRFDFLDSFQCVIGECNEIKLQPSFSNTMQLLATDDNGCIAEADVRYNVKKDREIYVPTAFTPNGDNNNDVLNVFGKVRQVKTIQQFRIYDRWGELIYEDKAFAPSDLARGWDGTFRDQNCLPDVYIWTAEVEFLDGHKERFYGQTTLVR